VMVSVGLAFHTNLKNRGRLFSAENLSFNVTSAIAVIATQCMIFRRRGPAG
jgi:hypothetical protein